MQYSIISLNINNYSYNIGVILNEVGKYVGYKLLSEVEILKVIGEENYGFSIHESYINICKKLFELQNDILINKEDTDTLFLGKWPELFREYIRISKPAKIDIDDNDYDEKLKMLYKVFV